MLDSTGTKTPSFSLFASAALVTALFGFWFTYWNPLFAGEIFPAVLHLHAALWFGWFVLLVAQTLLIQISKPLIHKRVGIAVVFYTAVLIVLSFVIAMETIARDAHLIAGSIESVPTIIPLTQILMFTALFVLAVIRRNQSDVHKRLIVLAALVAVTPAVARISIGLLGEPNVPLIFTVSNFLILIVAVVDWRATRRVHPVFLWGGVAIFLVRIFRAPLAMSPAWESIARGIAALTNG